MTPAAIPRGSGVRLIEAEGFVHLVSPIAGSEHTLCGDAFDLASDVGGYEWKSSRKKAVTCEKCAAVILACRGVRVGLTR